MIVVKITRDDSDDFSKCVNFVGKSAKKSLGGNFKIISNSKSFQVISDNDNDEPKGISAELIIKKTINFNEENSEEFFRKLDFFMQNANKIMDTIIDGNG